MGVFRKGLAYLFKDFSCWTSTHGIPHIGMANAIWLRLFWIIVVVACLVGFIIQLKMLISKYLSYGVNTQTKLEFSERPFPAVTICHLNPWKADALNGSAYMTALVAAYQDSDANATFGFDEGRTGARQQTAVDLTSLANQHLFAMMNDPSMPNPAYTYDDLVISCTYNAKTCYQESWNATRDPTFGLCQEFNFNESLSSSRAGSLYGLRVVMRIDQANYLPWTEAAGVVVSIHNKARGNRTDPPYPDVLGYYAPPSTASSMGISYTMTTRKGPPYGTCTSQTTADFSNYKGPYEVESCYRSCLQDEIIQQCGCYDPTYPYLGSGVSSCFGDASVESDWAQSAVNLDCINALSNTEETTFNLINDCLYCLQPCVVQTYAVTVSTAQWPSSDYTPAECTASNQSGQPWVGTNGVANEQACLAWYQTNTLLLEVYYQQLNYQILTESAAYTIVNLISDIGGQVGLFLGMSIISVIEIFTLFILLCYFFGTYKERKEEMAKMEAEAQAQVKKDEAKQKAEEAREETAEKQKKLNSQSQNAVYSDANPSTAYNVPPVQY